MYFSKAGTPIIVISSIGRTRISKYSYTQDLDVHIALQYFGETDYKV